MLAVVYAALASGWEAVNGSPGTGCSTRGSSFSYIVKRGDPTKLVIELEGGGCCFSAVTCALPEYLRHDPPEVTIAALNLRGGLGDDNNPLNPLANFSKVFVPYCTGDAHTGNHTPWYGTHHWGRNNFFDALQWAKANVPSPTTVLVTGVSAGAVGTYVLSPWVMDAYPNARHVAIADSYAPIFGRTGYNDGFANWDLYGAFNAGSIPIKRDELTPWRELINAFSLNITALAYPKAQFATYVSAYDSVESGFYVVEGCGFDGCDWPPAMRAALKAVGAPNYARYIGRGSLHGALMVNEVYEIASSGVKLVDWVRDMLAGRAVPPSIDCEPHC